jgi:hypothetical protein
MERCLEILSDKLQIQHSPILQQEGEADDPFI